LNQAIFVAIQGQAVKQAAQLMRQNLSIRIYEGEPLQDVVHKPSKGFLLAKTKYG
jgi:hypothetical protein